MCFEAWVTQYSGWEYSVGTNGLGAAWNIASEILSNLLSFHALLFAEGLCGGKRNKIKILFCVPILEKVGMRWCVDPQSPAPWCLSGMLKCPPSLQSVCDSAKKNQNDLDVMAGSIRRAVFKGKEFFILSFLGKYHFCALPLSHGQGITPTHSEIEAH